MPLLENHMYPSSLTDPIFNHWHAEGLRSFLYLYRDGTFCIYVQPSYEMGLPESNFFQFLQARHCSATLFPGYPTLPQVQIWEELLQL